MTNFLRQFAETTEASGDIFVALGIDWRLLILQIVAFLILVFLLGKFVYPWLMKSVDERQANIEAAAKAAKKAEESAAQHQDQIHDLLQKARKQAADIVATAKLESAEIVSTSETKAKESAEKIVADANAQINKDVEAARRSLYNETLDLVALATEKVAAVKTNRETDTSLIADTLKELK